MIREYILHDRGNSIFLGDSFANLPSPVAEGQTIKNLFKFHEDEENEKKLERENKEKNEIKIEGKQEKSKAPEKKSPHPKSKDIQTYIDEIDKIVFTEDLADKKKKKGTHRQNEKSDQVKLPVKEESDTGLPVRRGRPHMELIQNDELNDPY
mmetsp:Transcript_29103/g.43864  ORF Transcript_29103/g.43864 Transcript_29103/m.43864 type:complete len:152 (+) Transcript_29103:877-1332(+)|eukprot:CAMPEP_0170488312 /NCGR_PEP_ID=MMETSP0208-20121228/6897_1 /TAXON_ID=197538 /ORGANISM="Strombidium inclinatum, Strain S3" /LENGTH=151 /DNA_ID=CAMNT_0010762847 /DNA_START=856 /DNA_END=1311 /DNA_ORIENTATION=+